ncbi:hypothetical protein DUI87_16868 [Hirundo rustica rustica]|uniref:Reverse transcriptase domain-containing protein n=1 Tax=Hirundo rustica rustica TaxID=333673 RepID=A0A3M0K2M6_HIRRU|nr:hypothetical protein DUI87_16868 [Hirundo rustica rustica]
MISLFKFESIFSHTSVNFIKIRTCLTNLVAFCARMITTVVKGRARGVIYLDFCTAFDTVSHNGLSLNWRKKDLVGGLFGGRIGWMVTSTGQWSTTQSPNGHQCGPEDLDNDLTLRTK